VCTVAVEKGICDVTHTDVEQETQMLHSGYSNTAQVYYVAIIDILQKWDRWKRAERLFKALLGQDLDGVSAQKPEDYRQRFMDKMKGRECACTATGIGRL
jgi:hypothetical protein